MPGIITQAVRSLTSGDNQIKYPNIFGFSGMTASARKVSISSSLTISAFYSGINTIGNSIGILPHVVQVNDDNQRNPLKTHPAYQLLATRPNNYMSAFTWKHLMTITMLLRGDSYSAIIRNENGQITSFMFLPWDETTVIDFEGNLYYMYKSEIYTSDEVLHFKGFSFDGKTSKSVLQFAADSLGKTLNAQKYSSDALNESGLSYGVLETDKQMKGDVKEAVADAFESRLAKTSKHRSPVLDEGMKYKRITLTPDETKFIETYANGIEDIARWLNIPRHKLHLEGEGGYNALVQMEQDYLQSAILPISTRIKEELDYKLFSDSEKQQGLNVYQNHKKLLQVDPKSRGQFYKDLIFMGAISPNEIRMLEDMNPYADGDKFLQLSNLLTEEQVKKTLENGNN